MRPTPTPRRPQTGRGHRTRTTRSGLAGGRRTADRVLTLRTTLHDPGRSPAAQRPHALATSGPALDSITQDPGQVDREPPPDRQTLPALADYKRLKRRLTHRIYAQRSVRTDYATITNVACQVGHLSLRAYVQGFATEAGGYRDDRGAPMLVPPDPAGVLGEPRKRCGSELGKSRVYHARGRWHCLSKDQSRSFLRARASQSVGIAQIRGEPRRTSRISLRPTAIRYA